MPHWLHAVFPLKTKHDTKESSVLLSSLLCCIIVLFWGKKDDKAHFITAMSGFHVQLLNYCQKIRKKNY